MNRDSGAEKRRSSYRLVEQELRHIKNGRPAEMVNQEIPFNFPNGTRLSGNSMRSLTSFTLSKRSGVPTPNTSKIASISRSRSAGRNSALGKTPNSTMASSRPRSQSASRKTTLGNASGAMRPPNAKGLKRKSISHESLFQTPSFSSHRSSSKSPGSSLRHRGGGLDGGDPAKTIKLPKEKKDLAKLAKEVFAFFERHDAIRPKDWNELVVPRNLPVTKFNAMIKFLGSHFVGDDFFGVVKGDAEVEKIIELSKTLRYPGQLTKSHLKTANAQHAWPTCLAFLFWLTCRVDALVNPPLEKPTIGEELNGNGFQEAAFSSYLNLFPPHFQRVLTREHIDLEIANFKSKICEMYEVECSSKTVEELEQEKNDRVAELEKLKNEPNHAKILRERLNAEVLVKQELQNKIGEIEDLCKQYSNSNHLLLDQEAKQIEINAKESEIHRLQLLAKQQSISKKEADRLQSETRNLEKQLESLKALNGQLQEECEFRHHNKDALMNELSLICRGFSIVERYNENVRFFRLDESLIIPPNPFAPSELELWFQNASRTLRLAEDTIKDFKAQVQAEANTKNAKKADKTKEMEEFSAQVEELKTKLGQLKSFERSVEKGNERKREEALSRCSEVSSELETLKAKYEKAKESLAQFKERENGWKQNFKELQEVYKTRNEEYVNAQLALRRERQADEVFVEDLAQEMASNWNQFYVNHYGIDIESLLEPEEETATEGNQEAED